MTETETLSEIDSSLSDFPPSFYTALSSAQDDANKEVETLLGRLNDARSEDTQKASNPLDNPFIRGAVYPWHYAVHRHDYNSSTIYHEREYHKAVFRAKTLRERFIAEFKSDHVATTRLSVEEEQYSRDRMKEKGMIGYFGEKLRRAGGLVESGAGSVSDISNKFRPLGKDLSDGITAGMKNAKDVFSGINSGVDTARSILDLGFHEVRSAKDFIMDTGADLGNTAVNGALVGQGILRGFGHGVNAVSRFGIGAGRLFNTFGTGTLNVAHGVTARAILSPINLTRAVLGKKGIIPDQLLTQTDYTNNPVQDMIEISDTPIAFRAVGKSRENKTSEESINPTSETDSDGASITDSIAALSAQLTTITSDITALKAVNNTNNPNIPAVA